MKGVTVSSTSHRSLSLLKGPLGQWATVTILGCSVLTIIVLSEGRLRAQQSFEVATVKRSPARQLLPGLTRQLPSQIQVQGSQVTINNATLPELIVRIYDRPDFMVSMGEAGRLQERFDITAKLEDGFRGDLRDVRRMLQQLLVETFRLRVHVDAQEMRTYDLARASANGRLGSKITSFTSTCADVRRALGLNRLPGAEDPDRPCATRLSQVRGTTARRTFTGVSMPQFSNALTPLVGRPVIDKTGLSGLYDVELEFDVVPLTTDSDASRVSIAQALEDQLGLKLVGTTGKVDVLVIDSAVLPPNQ